MIVFNEINKGYVSGKFTCLGTKDFLKQGDVVTYGLWAPHMVDANNINNDKGFIITAWGDESIDFAMMYLNDHFIGIDKSVAFWRLTANILPHKPKEYIPSLWATPVPLP